MTRDGEGAHVDSEHCMELRVLLQAVAIVIVSVALFPAA